MLCTETLTSLNYWMETKVSAPIMGETIVTDLDDWSNNHPPR